MVIITIVGWGYVHQLITFGGITLYTTHMLQGAGIFSHITKGDFVRANGAGFRFQQHVLQDISPYLTLYTTMWWPQTL